MHIKATMIRHGEVDECYHDRFLGSTDAPLSGIGREQARSLHTACKDLQAAKLWCSPLKRARQTAQIVFPCRTPEIIPELREVDFGAWETLSFAEIAAQNPVLVDKWARFDEDFSFPDGESMKDFLNRIKHIADRMRREQDDLVLVTHGGVIRSLLCELQGLPPEKYVTFSIQRGGMLTVRISGN